MKVKRYRSIYTKRRRRPGPFAVIVMIIGALLLVFVGWSIAEPIQKLVTGQFRPAQKVSSSAAASSRAASSSKNAASSSKSSSQAQSQTASVKAIYFGSSYLSDTGSLSSALSAAKSAGLNEAIVELKDDTGKVYFNSQTAQSAGLLGSNVPDAASAASRISASGMKPAAEITCFEDNLAARAMRAAAIKYTGNHSYIWLANGSDAWLNPYSDAAVQYIAGLAKDAVSMGYKTIYLRGVGFPTIGNPTKNAWYGDTATTKEQALQSFVAAVEQAVKGAGGTVTVELPGDASVGQADALSGLDQSLYAYGSDAASPILCPSLFGKSVTIGSSAISKPDQTPGDTVAAAAQYIAQQAGQDHLAKTVPFIQAFTSTTLGSAYSKTYTADDVSAQITALKNAGISSFVLYSPKTSYDASLIAAASSSK